MTEVPTGWTTITRAPFFRMLAAGPLGTLGPSRSAGLMTLVVGWTILGVIGYWYGVSLPVFTAVAAVLGAITGIILMRAYLSDPKLDLNFDTNEARLGTYVLPFDAITVAVFSHPRTRGRSGWQLDIGVPDNAIASVIVRSSTLPELSVRDRELIAEMLRRSSVARPEVAPDRFDPTGKFAWTHHTNHLTRDEAIDYVLHTPKSGEPALARSRPKSIWLDDA